jgi:IS30 family transposase
MARMKSVSNLTISDLEQLLNRSRSKISKLEKKRAKVSRKLEAIDAQIASLGGSSSAGRAVRHSNGQSLAEVIHQVLKSKGSAMRVVDIAGACVDAGYHSTSDNFRSIVNIALIKDKRFVKTGERGVYVLKK